MKKLLLLFSVAAIFASSCSSKIGIAKRKYGKGYYVSVSHKPKPVNSGGEHTKQAAAPATETVAQVRVNKAEASKSSEQLKPATVAPVQVKEKSLASAKANSSTQALIASAEKKNSLKNNAVVKALNAATLSMLGSKKADDTNLIILVILCLFWWLNLLAVWLKQGKTITNDFWITLILDILVIFGIVYSILVVLDVLSFA